MCFLSTTFPNAPAHPPILFDQSLIHAVGTPYSGTLDLWYLIGPRWRPPKEVEGTARIVKRMGILAGEKAAKQLGRL